MKRVKLASVVASLFIIAVALSPKASRLESSVAQPTGKIMGVILDTNDARVVNATIKIDGGNIKREMKSGEEGEFEIGLPVGSYRVTVEAEGFRRFVSPPLKVKANGTEMINIHLEVGVYTQPIPVGR